MQQHSDARKMKCSTHLNTDAASYSRRNMIPSMTFFRCTRRTLRWNGAKIISWATKMNCGEATSYTLDSTEFWCARDKSGGACISPEFRPSRCHRHQSSLDIKLCRIKFETKMSVSTPKMPAHHIHNRQCRQMVFDEIRTRGSYLRHCIRWTGERERAERVSYMRPRSQITHSKWNRCTAAAVAQQFIFYSMLMRW